MRRVLRASPFAVLTAPNALHTQVVPTLISHEPSLSPHDWEAAVKRVLQGIEDGEWSKVRVPQLALAAHRARALHDSRDVRENVWLRVAGRACTTHELTIRRADRAASFTTAFAGGSFASYTFLGPSSTDRFS